jgi:hypothetical protein
MQISSDSNIYKNMTFTDSLEGTNYVASLENGKKRSIIDKNSWPDANGIPYQIYKAESNYSYKSFFCNTYFSFNLKLFVI